MCIATISQASSSSFQVRQRSFQGVTQTQDEPRLGWPHNCSGSLADRNMGGGANCSGASSNLRLLMSCLQQRPEVLSSLYNSTECSPASTGKTAHLKRFPPPASRAGQGGWLALSRGKATGTQGFSWQPTDLRTLHVKCSKEMMSSKSQDSVFILFETITKKYKTTDVLRCCFIRESGT